VRTRGATPVRGIRSYRGFQPVGGGGEGSGWGVGAGGGFGAGGSGVGPGAGSGGVGGAGSGSGSRRTALGTSIVLTVDHLRGARVEPVPDAGRSHTP
jgi:hypothetical protein